MQGVEHTCNCYECLAIGFYLHQEKKLCTLKYEFWQTKSFADRIKQAHALRRGQRVPACKELSAPMSDGRTVSLWMERGSCFTDWLTDWLTPCSRGHLEKPRDPQLVKKFLAFYGNRRSITAFTISHRQFFYRNVLSFIETIIYFIYALFSNGVQTQVVS